MYSSYMISTSSGFAPSSISLPPFFLLAAGVLDCIKLLPEDQAKKRKSRFCSSFREARLKELCLQLAEEARALLDAAAKKCGKLVKGGEAFSCDVYMLLPLINSL